MVFDGIGNISTPIEKYNGAKLVAGVTLEYEYDKIVNKNIENILVKKTPDIRTSLIEYLRQRTFTELNNKENIKIELREMINSILLLNNCKIKNVNFTHFYLSCSQQPFYNSYYVDKFGDETDKWLIYSEPIKGTSPNTIGGITEFECELVINENSVYFNLKRQNGDRYSGNGIIYVKLDNNEIKEFSADNYSNGFYPRDEEIFRQLILKEKNIKVVIEIENTNYSFNLGSIDLIPLHNMLK